MDYLHASDPLVISLFCIFCAFTALFSQQQLFFNVPYWRIKTGDFFLILLVICAEERVVCEQLFCGIGYIKLDYTCKIT